MKHCPLKGCDNIIEDDMSRCNKCEAAKERVRLNRIALFERNPEKRAQYNAASRDRIREKRKIKSKIKKIVIKSLKHVIPIITVAPRYQDGYLITDLPAGGCRYPISMDAVLKNRHRFCGVQTDKIYCTKHAKLVHNTKWEK